MAPFLVVGLHRAAFAGQSAGDFHDAMKLVVVSGRLRRWHEQRALLRVEGGAVVVATAQEEGQYCPFPAEAQPARADEWWRPS